jgi:hypothetical protein
MSFIFNGIRYSTPKKEVNLLQFCIRPKEIQIFHAPESRINQMNGGWSPQTIPNEPTISINEPIQTEQPEVLTEVDYGYGTTIYRGKEYKIVKPFGDGSTTDFDARDKDTSSHFTIEQIKEAQKSENQRKIETEMLKILESQKKRIAPKTYNRIKRHLKKAK